MTQERKTRILASSFVSGALFAAGLVIAGMTHPSKIFGFLDFFGTWDPSLMWVMVGAIAVNAPLTTIILRQGKPRFESGFSVPQKGNAGWFKQITPRLVIGSMLFGFGWGLGGYCPGPALVALGTILGSHEAQSAAVFVSSMIVGMALFSLYERLMARRLPSAAKPCCEPQFNQGTLTQDNGTYTSPT